MAHATMVLRRRLLESRSIQKGLIIAATLAVAAIAGQRPSVLVLALPLVLVGGIALIQQPQLGIYAMMFLALVPRFEIGTGTAVAINPVTVMVPALLGLWILGMIARRRLEVLPSKTNVPLVWFLASGIVSLVAGTALWDPMVPRSSRFIIVQAAQWAVFAFSAGAYWLVPNLMARKERLQPLVKAFLLFGGTLALLRVMPQTAPYVNRYATVAINRAPFWSVLTALVAGQLLFNRELKAPWKLFLWAVAGAIGIYVLKIERETLSYFAGSAAAVATLAWMRSPKLRPVYVAGGLILVVAFFPALYEFAGGEAEWEESGGSRLTLIRRVVEDTMRNPITGLGPAAYRAYGKMRPLQYGRALWLEPNISSHNNYVDLFSHVGLVGLSFFLWFAIRYTRLAMRLSSRQPHGFDAAYVNSALAIWASSMALMLFADWILPFVYNIGFPGFQASILAWLFMGGLILYEQEATE